jgi:sulfide:quinone oxidoreductase
VAVDGRRRIAMLAGGELLPYDHLIVAVGARSEAPLADALTFRGHADAAELRALVDGIAEHAARGARSELAIIVPGRCGWPLTAYEIALMVHEHLASERQAGACRITVLTAEETPLAAFGADVGPTVARTLGRAGVTVRAATSVTRFRWGRLDLADGQAIPADRVVALPSLSGPRIDGLPADAHGFIDCAADGTVAGAPGVRVIGDAGSAEVRQGGLACRQADHAAVAVAHDLGFEVTLPPLAPGLTEADWDPAGRWHDHGDGRDVVTSLPWPVPRLSGRFLAPFLNEISHPLPVL